MAQSVCSGARPEAAEMQWDVHLARRKPWRAVGVSALIVLSAAVAHGIWHHPLAALVTAALVASAVAEFLFPIHYRITSDGVLCRNFLSARYLKWSEVKHCYRDAQGVKLSPLSKPSRLETYRGIYLWLGDDPEAVLAAIRTHLHGGAS
jgi:hypothetical protein